MEGGKKMQRGWRWWRTLEGKVEGQKAAKGDVEWEAKRLKMEVRWLLEGEARWLKVMMGQLSKGLG